MIHVTTSTVDKLVIENAGRLPTISVYLEDCGAQRGKVTITCDGNSWTNFWGSMGDGCDIRTFFSQCDNDYLVKKLSPSTDRTVCAWDLLEAHAGRYLCKQRRSGELTKTEARRRFNRIGELEFDQLELVDDESGKYIANDVMQDVFGDEWWFEIPQEPNPRYDHLCRILTAVKEALAQTVAA